MHTISKLIISLSLLVATYTYSDDNFKEVIKEHIKNYRLKEIETILEHSTLSQADYADLVNHAQESENTAQKELSKPIYLNNSTQLGIQLAAIGTSVGTLLFCPPLKNFVNKHSFIQRVALGYLWGTCVGFSIGYSLTYLYAKVIISNRQKNYNNAVAIKKLLLKNAPDLLVCPVN